MKIVVGFGSGVGDQEAHVWVTGGREDRRAGFNRTRISAVMDHGRMGPNELRAIFDEDARLYDRMRPGYPVELFDDLHVRVGLGQDSRIVEIAPGTGQATADLAGRGAQVVAVELGAELAAVLRARTTGLPVEVIVSSFEDWDAGGRTFDAVMAFTAWHWLDPAVRGPKIAELLKPGGSLVTVTTEHVLGGTEQFFADAQRCYESWDPATPPGLRLTPAEEIPAFVDEVDGSALFEPATRKRFRQDIAYSTEEYLDLLRTYSGHRALEPERRNGLLGSIGELIDGRYGGSITKAYLYEVRIAARRIS